MQRSRLTRLTPRSYMTCVRLNTGWKYCVIGVLAGMGLGILKAS